MIPSLDILKFSREHENVDVHQLALHGKKYPAINLAEALQQIKGLQIAKHKIPSWYNCQDVLYPIHLSLEQCSSEKTALYKKEISPQGLMMVDLTGGLGVDTYFLASNFEKTTYVEQQESLTILAQHNFNALNSNSIKVVNQDSVEYLEQMDHVDFIFIDPARRDTKGRKTTFIEDCTPNLIDIQNLLDTKAAEVMIKLSPMLDISLALEALTNISAVHIVSVDNECKELLFIKDNLKTREEPTIHCTNLVTNKESFSFMKLEEENAITRYTSSLATYIYEPNASIMKAGAYKIICDRYGIEKLHPSSHIYTSNNLIQDFPGRRFKVLKISSLNKKDIKRDFANITQANISTRNFPLKPEELKKRLNLKDGGDIYIFGTTLADNQKAILICEKI